MRAPARAVETPACLTLVAGPVERRLGEVLDAERRRWTEFDPDVTPFIDALAQLAQAGRKRLRPAFCHWAYVGAGGDPADPLVVDAGAAFELLHAFALVHDDVMDGSATRRGAPDRPRRVRRAPRRGSVGGARPAASARGWPSSSATWPTSTPTSCWPAPRPTPGRLARAAARAQRRPVPRRARHRSRRPRAAPGPTASPGTSRASTRSNGRCTSARRWPAGSATSQVPLSAYGDPLGEAFQLRDDILGAFGDERLTGKPVGDDLREGKPTPLLAIAAERTNRSQRAVLDRVGDRGLSSSDVAAVQEVLVSTGALAEVETTIERLLSRGLEALERAPITSESKLALAELGEFVAWRGA